MGDVVTVGSRPFVHGHVVVCMNSNLCFFVRRLGVCVRAEGLISCLPQISSIRAYFPFCSSLMKTQAVWGAVWCVFGVCLVCVCVRVCLAAYPAQGGCM